MGGHCPPFLAGKASKTGGIQAGESDGGIY